MPHLTSPSYDELRRTFTWERARAELDGLPGGRGLNIAHEAVDRHVDAGDGDRVALRCVEEDGVVSTTTYEQLRRETNRFANVLTELGVGRGDRVMTLLGRQQEQYVAALGTLKRGAVFSPLFSSFGPEPIRERLRLSGARVLVTTPSLHRRKVAGLLDDLPSLEHVLVVGEPTDERTASLTGLMALASEDFTIPPTDPEDPALLHFTSGTTGKPKGAVHVHEAVVAHHATARFALDLHAGDVFWCTADPGWVTGTSYGIIAPLTHGATLISYAGEFDARRLVPAARRAAGQRLVHRPHRAADAAQVRRGGGAGARPLGPAAHRQRRRAAQPRGRHLGDGGLRHADPRQLVADRDRRDHDQQLPRHGDPARLDGPADARDRGRGAGPRRGRPGARRGRGGAGRRPRGDRGARAAAGLAVDVPRLPRRGGALRRPASPAAGTSPGTSPAPTRTATSGSSAAPTT